MELQTGNPYFCAECCFPMQLCFWHAPLLHCTIVHYLAAWRHHGLSFVYETSLTFRWLMMMMEEEEENCHLLTTTFRTDKGRGKKHNYWLVVDWGSGAKYFMGGQASTVFTKYMQ